MRCLHVSVALTLLKHSSFFSVLSDVWYCYIILSLRLSFVFLSLVNHNTNGPTYSLSCSFASFHLTLLFYLISCFYSVPSHCMNNTCCHACVCLCTWSHPPACLGAVLKWLVSYFLWCLPAFWACEYLQRTYTTLLSIPQPSPLAIPAPSHKNDAIELN